MPLDTSIYTLAQLRLDGRRWHEIRHIHAQTSISNVTSSTTGSSYLEMGGTKVLCSVGGPFEGDGRRRGGGGGGGGRGEAQIQVDVNIAGFSGTDRRRAVTGGVGRGGGGGGGGDKRTTELSHALSTTLSTALLTHLYPSSTIAIAIHVLAQDGSLLATCLNAATLALVDAGVPMTGYAVGCTVGVVGGDDDSAAEPVLDVNALEELELPFLTIATGGGVNSGIRMGDDDDDGDIAGFGAAVDDDDDDDDGNDSVRSKIKIKIDGVTAAAGGGGVGVGGGGGGGGERRRKIAANAKISLLMLETRVPADKLEDMLSVGIEGCDRVRRILDKVVRSS